MSVPPALIGLVSATYGIRTLISISKRRKQFNALLAHRLNITSSLYFRIMCFAGIGALTITPITVSFIVFNVKSVQLNPWISWEHSHSDVHRVVQYSAVIWHEFPDASAYEFIRWIHILAAFSFFAIFGFAEEAKSHYRLTINFILRLIGFQVGRQTETLRFQTGPRSSMMQSELAKRPTEVPRRTDFLSTVSMSPNCGGSSGEYVDNRTGNDIPGKSLALITNARVPAAGVEQENERTPGNSLNLHSFLNLDHSDSSTHYISFAQKDISTIEQGQPAKANRRSSNQLSQPLYSFLNFN